MVSDEGGGEGLGGEESGEESHASAGVTAVKVGGGRRELLIGAVDGESGGVRVGAIGDVEVGTELFHCVEGVEAVL